MIFLEKSAVSSLMTQGAIPGWLVQLILRMDSNRHAPSLPEEAALTLLGLLKGKGCWEYKRRENRLLAQLLKARVIGQAFPTKAAEVPGISYTDRHNGGNLQ